MNPYSSLSLSKRIRCAAVCACRATLALGLLATAVVVSRPVGRDEPHVSQVPAAAAKISAQASRNQRSASSYRIITAPRPRVAVQDETVAVKLNSTLTFYDCMDQ